MVRCLLSLLLLLFLPCQAQIIHRITTAQWKAPTSLTAMVVTVGDTITFTWNDSHNVYKQLTQTCPDRPLSQEDSSLVELLGETSPVSYNFTAQDVGFVYFTCLVGSHCESGMNLQVTVQEASVPTPAPRPTPLPTSAGTATWVPRLVGALSLVVVMAAWAEL